jgi:hypothetical protein
MGLGRRRCVRTERATAGPSTSLRSGRDDNSVGLLKLIPLAAFWAFSPQKKMSSREPVTFSIFSCFLRSYNRMLSPPQSRHPERSAARIYRITDGLWRAVEGPRRCLLADALPSFPATNYRPNQQSHKLRPERSEVEGPAVSLSVLTYPLEANRSSLNAGSKALSYKT